MNFENKIFLTFDVDWAIDELLEFNYAIIKKHQIKASFFITHDSPFINVLRRDEKIEVGIHPNFNVLLEGTHSSNGEGYKTIIDDLINIEPEAVSFRSHSLTQSSIISAYAARFLKYDLNCFIPQSAGIVLKPFLCFSKMISVPYFFGDDVAFADVHFMEKAVKNQEIIDNYLTPNNSLKVFDFHPIHIFLNTENPQRYNEAKPYYKDYGNLKKYVNRNSFGTHDFLENLITRGKERGMEFLSIRDIDIREVGS